MSTISRLKIAVFSVLVVVALAVPGAQASTIAVNFDDTTGAQLGNGPFTLGWSFTALNDITVTDLGIFDSGQDGLVDAYSIGLWDSSQNLLVSASLPSGTSATLVDKFRFVSVADTALLGGQTYFIGAVFNNETDEFLFPGDATGFTTASDISFLQSQFASGGSLTFPSSSAGSDPSYFGPNFRFDATGASPVPEPASLLLLGTGLLPIARRAYRRRTAR